MAADPHPPPLRAALYASGTLSRKQEKDRGLPHAPRLVSAECFR